MGCDVIVRGRIPDVYSHCLKKCLVCSYFNYETSQNMNRAAGQLLNLQEREIITAALILYVHYMYILDYTCIHLHLRNSREEKSASGMRNPCTLNRKLYQSQGCENNSCALRPLNTCKLYDIISISMAEYL